MPAYGQDPVSKSKPGHKARHKVALVMRQLIFAVLWENANAALESLRNHATKGQSSHDCNQEEKAWASAFVWKDYTWLIHKVGKKLEADLHWHQHSLVPSWHYALVS